MSKLITEKIIHKSGIRLTQGTLEVLKQKNFIVLTESAGGDAPKDVIRLYEYGRCLKSKPRSWIKYIAKIGHKWYPNESITEHFLTVLGKSFGIDIADSKIVFAENHIRFLSEHFHSGEQTLEHGANILSRYINESNTEWIDEMDRNRSLKGEITFVDVEKAIQNVFEEQADDIINKFIHMLLFDALSGNNDRHYYNWGIVVHIKNEHEPYFSPVYDSARGVFWNMSDEKVVDLHAKLEKGDNKSILRYVNKSAPKISIPNNDRCNHFQLVEYLKYNGYIREDHINVWSDEKCLNKVLNTLNDEFKPLFISERRSVIGHLLALRFKKLSKILEA